MSRHIYNQTFMDYTAASATRSANTVISLLMQHITVKSILDIGCARGAWAAAWLHAGASQIMGVDGHYVDKSTLLIPADSFRAQDLNETFNLDRKFDLVQSLEVAEHIQAEKADCFIANLVRHANGIILFSAAPPGQGGEYHVNEQPYDYWREKFATYGFMPFDYFRPQLAGRAEVSPWYRYNTLLYVHKDNIASLPVAIRHTAIKQGQPIPDISPPWYKVRKFFIRILPQRIQDELAAFLAARNRT